MCIRDRYYGIGEDVRGQNKKIRLSYGRLVSAGVRATTLVGNAAVVYSDEDGDGFFETATVTVPKTNLPDGFATPNQIKLYYEGRNAQPEWEIRPLDSVTITALNVVITLKSWLLVKLELLGAYPTDDDFRAIDVSTVNNFETSVDVYREYVDTTQSSVTFYWDPSTASPCLSAEVPCDNLAQNGCVYTIDPDTSLVAPIPASYSTEDGVWQKSVVWTGTVEPDRVGVWYYAGDRSAEYLAGSSLDPLSHWWAQTIAWIATARLPKALCECSNARAIAEDLATDLSFSVRGETYFTPREILKNPLGTRKGEVKAWQRISKVINLIRSSAYASVG